VEGYLLKLTLSIIHTLYPCMRHVGAPAMRRVGPAVRPGGTSPTQAPATWRL
jgi:hypothetical protein